MLGTGELTSFILFTAIHCFILGAVIFRIKKGNGGNRALSLVFILFGIYLIEFYGVVEDSWPVWMSLWTYPLLYALGPLLFRLVKQKLASSDTGQPSRSTQWILLGIYLLFIPFFFVNYSAADLVESSDKLPLFYRFILAILIYPVTYQLYTLVWLGIAGRYLLSFQTPKEQTSIANQILTKRRDALRLFLVLLIIYLLVGITYELLNLRRQSIDFLPYIYLNLSLSLLLQGFGYIILFRPELLRNLKPLINERKYERDLIPETSLSKLTEQLSIFWKEKPYLSDDFQLEQLARHLSLSKNQASQLVNRVHGMSFSKWVKTCRISYAMRYWEQHTNGKPPRVKDMIYSSGFQNTVSFYRAFKEVTGESFPEFKERQQKKITSYDT